MSIVASQCSVQGPWILGLGAGVTDPFTYHTDSYSWGEWAERNQYAGGIDYSGSYQAAHTTEDSFVKLLPGFGAGFGMEGPLSGSARLDVGARYLYSADPGSQELGEFSSGSFEGLRQWRLLASIRIPL